MNDMGGKTPRGRPIVVDDTAVSANSNLPAFLARPVGAPVYHGFPIVEESETDGWALGMISDFGDSEAHYGDSYVVTPDGSRCGLVWECCSDKAVFSVILPPEADRWGVYSACLAQPLHGPGDARTFLAALLPRLEPQWKAWAAANH